MDESILRKIASQFPSEYFDDLVQEGRIAIWRKGDRVKNWNYLIRNAMVNWMRVFANKPAGMKGISNLARSGEYYHQYEDYEFKSHDIDDIDFYNFLKKITPLLTDDEYDIIKMRILGYTNAEIGEKFNNISEQAIFYRLKNIQKKIKKRLNW